MSLMLLILSEKDIWLVIYERIVLYMFMPTVWN